MSLIQAVKKNGKIITIPKLLEPMSISNMFPSNVFQLSEDFASYVRQYSGFKILQPEDIHGALIDDPTSDKVICREMSELMYGKSNLGNVLTDDKSILWRLSNLGKAQKGGVSGDLLTDGFPNIIGYTVFRSELVSIVVNLRMVSRAQSKNDFSDIIQVGTKTTVVDVPLWHCVVSSHNTWHRAKVFFR